MGLRDAILAAPDIRREVVEVPEWGCSVTVQTINAGRIVEYFQHLTAAGDDVAAQRATLVVAACIDERGDPLFQWSDVQALTAKAGVAIARLYSAALRISALAEADDNAKN